MDVNHTRVEQIDGKGRGLVAKRDIMARDIVLTEKPYAFCLYEDQYGKRCDYCFKRNQNLKTCSTCKLEKYCNRQCQRSAWGIHRSECRCSKIVRNILGQQIEKPPTTIMLFTRLRQKLGIKVGAALNQPGDDDDIQSINDLQSNYEHFGDERKAKCKDTYDAFILLPENKITKETFDDLYGRVSCNLVSIYDGTDYRPTTVLGSGIYLRASMLNHSCDFNCSVTFDSTTMNIIADKDITAGEECTVCYVDVSRPTKKRREDLREKYFFDCSCRRCSGNH